MGLARLTKVTVISPRTDYEEVAKSLAKFGDFHPVEGAQQSFDPMVQELTVKAVRLFSQADQAAKDIGLKLTPGWMDQVFRGAKLERMKFEAKDWRDMLANSETELEPIVQEVKGLKASLQKASKEEMDSKTLRDALQAVSGFSADLGGVGGMKLLKSGVYIVPNGSIDEFRKSLPESVFVVHELNQTDALVLVSVASSETGKLEKSAKALDAKQLVLPANLPQNPTLAYAQLSKDYESAGKAREEIEAKLAAVAEKSASRLLAIRELTEAAREMLDEARVSGDMQRMATISGFIPSRKEGQFREQFGRWIVHTEPLNQKENDGLPVLMENRRGARLWQLITAEQGLPGKSEVDPTPLISFVFPIFFGLMFGDLGHGLVFTLFVLFVRQRVSGTKRQWANIFLVTGISSMFFGALFGEFFGFSVYSIFPIPPVAQYLDLEFINHSAGQPVIPVFVRLMIISMVIGIMHLVTGLALDLYEAIRAGEKVEVIIEKLPALTMYLSGVGYGISFIVAGFSFNVLDSSVTVPFFGIPNNLLGSASMAVLIPSMLVLFLGRAVAVRVGAVEGHSFAGALSEGGLEVFEKILQFLSNTISYVRLAVMLLVHAVLLLIITGFFPPTDPVYFLPWAVFNLMVLALEGLIVYVQDLRLHVYEFFTKFYVGTGRPFRKILPDRARVEFSWN